MSKIFMGSIDATIRSSQLSISPKESFDIELGTYCIVKEDEGNHKFLSVYPFETWDKNRFRPLFKRDEAKGRELVLSTRVIEKKSASYGRKILLLPRDLLRYLNLREGSEVEILGAGDHFDIWKRKEGKEELSRDLTSLFEEAYI